MLQKHAAIAKCPGADMGQERRELRGFPPFRVDSREIGAIHANRSPADAQGNAKRVSPPPLGVRALPPSPLETLEKRDPGSHHLALSGDCQTPLPG
jgi:hypothetical protein